MPAELHPFSMCLSNISWSRTVPSSKPGQSYEVTYGEMPPNDPRGNPLTHGFQCTCPAFKFRKTAGATCKHIDQVKAMWCGWHQQHDGGEPVNDLCPRCGGPVTQVMCAV